MNKKEMINKIEMLEFRMKLKVSKDDLNKAYDKIASLKLDLKSLRNEILFEKVNNLIDDLRSKPMDFMAKLDLMKKIPFLNDDYKIENAISQDALKVELVNYCKGGPYSTEIKAKVYEMEMPFEKPKKRSKK